MKNEMSLDQFENLELTLKEKNEVEGGWFWVAMAGSFCYACLADWNENVAAFNAGRKAAAKY